MLKLLLIASGGAVGSLLRYAISGWCQRIAGEGFPWGTLAVNVIGCVAIGAFGAFVAGPHLVREEHRAAVIIGLLGAFTTFSTFGWETLELANDGRLGWAALNVALSNALGLAGVWIGCRLIEQWAGQV